jgi:hypothetical protein
MSQTPLPEEKVSTSTPTGGGTERLESATNTLNKRILIGIVSAALFISFFLPWANFFGAKLSGLDIQKNFSSYALVWALPAFALITFVANAANQNTNLVHRVTGAIPFCILVYSMNQLGNDVWQIFLPGAWLALASGAILMFAPNPAKKA